jgi:AraC-like DNA-binding protein
MVCFPTRTLAAKAVIRFISALQSGWPIVACGNMRHADCSAHALPLNNRLFQEPFYVTHAGWERVRPHQSYPRPGHPAYYGFRWEEGRVLGEFCLWLISRGQGELQTKQGRQVLRAGDACLYRPGEWHRHRPLPAVGWSNVWLNFSGNLPHQWLRDGNFRLNQNLVQVAHRRLFAQQFRHLVESVDAAGTRNSRQFSWQAIGLISHFLADAPASEPPAKDRPGDPIVDVAMDFIWSQSHNQIGVPDVARHTGVNRRTLERRFRTVTGSTVLNEIQRCRISRAELLLRETDEPIKYVIGRAGFASYQQLRQAFRKHFSLSPESYRRKAPRVGAA